MVLNGATVRNGFKARNPFLSVSCPSEDEKHRETTGINKHENPYYLSFFGDSSWSAESSEGFPKPGVGGSSPPEGAAGNPCDAPLFATVVIRRNLKRDCFIRM